MSCEKMKFMKWDFTALIQGIMKVERNFLVKYWPSDPVEQLRNMLTSPTQTGSRVGSRYTAISLEFLAPVANNVFEGFICTECIPHCWSCGNVMESLLPCNDGIWSNRCVTTSYTISCEQFHTLSWYMISNYSITQHHLTLIIHGCLCPFCTKPCVKYSTVS